MLGEMVSQGQSESESHPSTDLPAGAHSSGAYLWDKRKDTELAAQEIYSLSSAPSSYETLNTNDNGSYILMHTALFAKYLTYMAWQTKSAFLSVIV